MHGKGMYYFSDGCLYEGDYVDGKRSGRGVYRFPDGSFFEGEYRDGVVEGRGTFTFADGSAEVGRWEDGQPIGEATRFSPDHSKAWRIFDGEVTGPVSLDLADVIAQMAFRPRAAKIARAVREQIADVDERSSRQYYTNGDHSSPPPSAWRSGGGGDLQQQRAYGMNPLRGGPSPRPPPIEDRPPWQGPLEYAKKPQCTKVP